MPYIPPTFIASYSSSYSTTTTPRTISVTSQPGDLLVVIAAAENGAQVFTGVSGNGLTWTENESDQKNAVWCDIRIYSATDTTGGTNWNLSVSRSASGYAFGATCFVFRNSDGVGQSNSAAEDGYPTLDVTTTQQNSAIVVVNADWNATSGASRVWRTVNGITPTAGNGLERLYHYGSGVYTVYGAYYEDAGAPGTKTIGLSTPNQKYSIGALEIRDTNAPDPPAGIPVMWMSA